MPTAYTSDHQSAQGRYLSVLTCSSPSILNAASGSPGKLCAWFQGPTHWHESAPAAGQLAQCLCLAHCFYTSPRSSVFTKHNHRKGKEGSCPVTAHVLPTAAVRERKADAHVHTRMCGASTSLIRFHSSIPLSSSHREQSSEPLNISGGHCPVPVRCSQGWEH